MKRICGYINMADYFAIDLAGMSDYEKEKTIVAHLQSCKDVDIVKYEEGRSLLFSFILEGEKYFFKYDSLGDATKEVIAAEICDILNLSHVDYDLAILGPFRGTISKNFKSPTTTYITGEEILRDAFHNPKSAFDEEIARFKSSMDDMTGFPKSRELLSFNSLEGIEEALRNRYNAREDCETLIEGLMNEIVGMLLLDILIGNVDRTPKNWMIAEKADGKVEVAPVLDHARAFSSDPHLARLALTVKNKDLINDPYCISLDQNVRDFAAYKGGKLLTQLLYNLWILSEENVDRICQKISDKKGVSFSKKTLFDLKQIFMIQQKALKDFLEIEKIPSIKIAELETVLRTTESQNSYYRHSAMSLVTPLQTLHVYVVDPSIMDHSMMMDILTKKIYGSEDIVLQNSLCQVRYVMEKDKCAYFDLPYYITSSEYSELEKIVQTLEDMGYSYFAIIHPFDPITGKELSFMPKACEGRNFLEILKNEDHIIDYDLPFDKEIVLNDDTKEKAL